MARVCGVRHGAHVFIILCTFITASWCLNDYHFYNIENANSYNEHISFQIHEHPLEKRDITNNLATSNESTPKPVHTNIKMTTEDSMVSSANKTMTSTIEDSKVTQKANPTKVISMTEPTAQAKDMISAKDVKETKPPKKVNPSTGNANPSIQIDDDDEVSISKFADPSFNLNKTLQDNNINVVQNDSHIYYNSSFRTDEAALKHFWVDVDSQVEMKISELLSRSHRRAATVRLSFEFPFYGHYIRNVTIATGGFLYTGDYVHSWLAATQYIAPLMANFDTSLANESYIKYLDNGTSFTVLWENVALQDKPDEGKFTFQTTLHSNGDIVFAYENVPTIIENIQDNHHPVKIGLSDAYIIDRTIFFMRRKTIYEYHRVNFRKEDIRNGTVIFLSSLPTCPLLKNCTLCLTKPLANFQCAWCPSLNKCSNGLDRGRQDWLTKQCDKRQVHNDSECSQPYSEVLPDDHDLAFNHHDHPFDPFDEQVKGSRVQDSSVFAAPTVPTVRMGVSSIMAILFLVSLLSGVVVWVLYAFRNPHTFSGQILIRYRPSQWTWRRGEARYTAATIHM